MYWREKEDCDELFVRAVDAFEKVLKVSKLENRVRLVNLIMDIVVENGLAGLDVLGTCLSSKDWHVQYCPISLTHKVGTICARMILCDGLVLCI